MSKYFRKWYKCPKTQNEKRQNQDEYEGSSKYSAWCRAKRRPCHLADQWDDRPRGHQRSWKKFRRTKYRLGHRGTKHTMFIKGWTKVWALREYCETHDVPYNMERVTEPYTYRAPIYEKYVYGKIPRYVMGPTGQHQAGYIDLVEWTIVGYKNVHTHRLLGYDFTWWSDKDIGVEYILRKE